MSKRPDLKPIQEHFGMGDSWLSNSKTHRAKIEKLYGEINIATVQKYIDYQDQLAAMFVKCFEERIVSIKEIATFLWNKDARASVYNLYDRLIVSKTSIFYSFHTILTLEKFQLLLKQKCKTFEKFQIEWSEKKDK